MVSTTHLVASTQQQCNNYTTDSDTLECQHGVAGLSQECIDGYNNLNIDLPTSTFHA